jgi:ATP-dependent Clp protease protease subunit
MNFSARNLAIVATVLLITGVSVFLNAKSPKDSSTSTRAGVTRTLELDKYNTLTMFDEVRGDNSEKVANAIANLNKLGSDEPIYLLLDSPGGSVIAGAKVVNAIEASKRPVHTVCVTICASMAAVIHSYGHKRLAANRAILMYHDASGQFQGEFARINSLFSAINRYVEKFDENIVKRSKMDRATFENLQIKEIWIDTEDAMAKGLVDELVFVNTSSFGFTENVEEKKSKVIIKPRTTFDVSM